MYPNPHAGGVTDEGSVNDSDNLFAGEFPRQVRKGVLISGQNVVRGTVLGRITASGKYNKSLSAASDGSEAPRAIAAHDVDASAGDKEIMFYETGDFNELALVLGTGHTIASIRDGLRDLSIFLKRNIPA
jgi:hypothetical protein